MKMAIDDLAFTPDYLLIDAMQLDVPQPQESLIKGDARSISMRDQYYCKSNKRSINGRI